MAGLMQVRRATQDRSSVYEKVVEATKETLSKALEDAPAFATQVLAVLLFIIPQLLLF